MDIGITVRYRESKNKDNGVEEKSNIPISNWAEIFVIKELKSNAVLNRHTPA